MSNDYADSTAAQVTGKAETVSPEAPSQVSAKVAKAVAKRGKAAPRGVHVVFNVEGVPVAAHSGEVSALRAAIGIGGTTRFVEYGDPFTK